MNTRMIFTLALLTVWIPLPATEVTYREVHEQPKTINDDPQNYIQVVIDRERYQCAPLADWVLMSNPYGWDFGALSKTHNGYVAVRVEPCVDNTGAPLQKLTQELIDQKMKLLKPEGPRYEGSTPTLAENATEYECDVTRLDGNNVSKCHYRFLLAGDRLYTFACDAPTDHFDDSIKVYGILAASFSRVAN